MGMEMKDDQKSTDLSKSNEAACYVMDIVNAGNTANDCMEHLDGTPAGLSRATVAVRNAIFAAFHLGRETA